LFALKKSTPRSLATSFGTGVGTPILVPPLRFHTSATVYAFSSLLKYFIQLPILGFTTFHRLRYRIPVLHSYPSKRYSLPVATQAGVTRPVWGDITATLALSPFHSPLGVSTGKRYLDPKALLH
jgi:hypothetical protein